MINNMIVIFFFYPLFTYDYKPTKKEFQDTPIENIHYTDPSVISLP